MDLEENILSTTGHAKNYGYKFSYLVQLFMFNDNVLPSLTLTIKGQYQIKIVNIIRDICSAVPQCIRTS